MIDSLSNLRQQVSSLANKISFNFQPKSQTALIAALRNLAKLVTNLIQMILRFCALRVIECESTNQLRTKSLSPITSSCISV